ncbi:Trp biosynthesis-associated membrane protein [Nocardioides marmoriginsengisoli]|uniref:Trp biosynthesis-associated membrane protein n=1 Tax=Nocardioides marmoriginsengisoli TaxID=661483 RepID=UPI001C836A11|nr:Trp biosynthesis-associated membrane protein [Nocardioides marmoriginsengisoli]
MAEVSGRRTFGPILLAGVATGALAAVASSQTWLTANGDAAGIRVSVEISGSDAAPLALALALVSLASWGVVLVSGTTARRLALVVGAAATIGVLIVAFGLDGDGVAGRALADRGASAVRDLSHRPWLWTTVVAAVLQLGALVAGFRSAPTWPSMSSRYDAPAAAASAADPDADPADVDDLTLWKALDEGQDPTAR